MCNIEKPQQKYRVGTVSNRLLGGGGGGGGGGREGGWCGSVALTCFTGPKTRHLLLQWFKTFVRMKVS